MKVIPAIDLLDGNVVRLHKGDYKQATVYNRNPLLDAKTFQDAGFEHIHIVDLNGARTGEFENLKKITTIIERTGLSVQTGGGIRSYEDADMLLKQGISRIICSSMAVRKPDDWLKLLDEQADHAILGMDLKNGKVAYAGWEETADDSIEDFLKPMIKRGLRHVLCTDISRDGTLEGPNVTLYTDLMEQFPELNFIASGGVGSYQDLLELEQAGVGSVVVGRAYYEEKLTLEQLSEFA
ncbi:MAG: 1-(5-phosphoribosyl)-5-[(5-phosphoribosylamino)methylideneamino]imidazole-4-carboxamide isomerase [Balneolaceae bacterium]|nr:1-(5-phosphoribosyl)-5-[(5-phosphoribosylamino)methylideneamino]imidazole-4-carboxamide isomerase [Balneolaceae bacterium]